MQEFGGPADAAAPVYGIQHPERAEAVSEFVHC
jgi:hypothetical protein